MDRKNIRRVLTARILNMTLVLAYGVFAFAVCTIAAIAQRGCPKDGCNHQERNDYEWPRSQQSTDPETERRTEAILAPRSALGREDYSWG